MNKIESPVFIVGSSRSGTTLLYSILLATGKYPVYEAETFLLENYPPKYGNLENRINKNKFLVDWLGSEQFRRSKIEPVQFSENVNNQAKNYLDVLDIFMSEITKSQNKACWVEKTPSHIFHIDKLSKYYPNGKFIQIIRDGRDVTLSKKKLGWSGIKSRNSETELVCAAKSWEMAVNTGRKLGNKIGKNYLEVKYEELILDKNVVFNKINEFLGLNITEELVNNSNIGALKRNNSAFGDNVKGITNKGIERWNTEMTEKEIMIINTAIGKTLIKLKYCDINTYNELKMKYPTLLTALVYKLRIMLCEIMLKARRLVKHRFPYFYLIGNK